ncbi:MAG: 50S ribosomal protein L25 [Gammaproteobacteria bacterium]|nr:MAG: 50S ribosomal protein L25 [Gammaproteobacteria bacterium]
MEALFELEASLRADKGKGASRRLRRANKVPAIVYGGEAEPLPIALDHDAVMQRLAHEAFYSHIITLKIDGRTEEVVLRDLQRHPVKPTRVLHLDFQRVAQDKPIHVHVPLHFVNEDKCVGVKQGGGILSHVLTEVEVVCLPRDLPEYIEVDVTELGLGESIHLSELKLPAGVKLAVAVDGEHDTAVVTVHRPRVADEAEGAAGEEGGEGESGA